MGRKESEMTLWNVGAHFKEEQTLHYDYRGMHPHRRIMGEWIRKVPQVLN